MAKASIPAASNVLANLVARVGVESGWGNSGVQKRLMEVMAFHPLSDDIYLILRTRRCLHRKLPEFQRMISYAQVNCLSLWSHARLEV
jgi:hypothetical protein